MQADYIENIVGKLKEMSYRCILIDGVWGIGKTYAVNQALEHERDVCRISLFGLQNSGGIYHEALFQSAFRNNKAGRIGEYALGALEGLTSVFESMEKAKDVLQSIAREKELFQLQSKSFDSWHIIVIDDLERLSDSVNMEEVLGVVEELKQCSYVKIILIANTAELKGKNGEIFERYQEKVIDRTYHITERPEKINWGNIGIDAQFLKEFLSRHKARNLRTLQKAQKFYEDVLLYCSEIKNDRFLHEVRLICFAIVVESTDKIYYREIAEDTPGPDLPLQQLWNEPEHRILNYLTGIQSRKKLVSMLLAYYENQCAVTSENLKIEFEMYIEAGKKSNFYKTDDEIKRAIPGLYRKMKEAKSIGELNQFADECMVWREITGEDNTEILNDYRCRLHAILMDMVDGGKEDILSYNIDLWHLSSETIKRVYMEQRDVIRPLMIQKLIDHLEKTTKGQAAYEYSCKLREYFHNNYYRDIIKEKSDVLYKSGSFPVGDCDDTRYRTSYNIVYVLYHSDKDKFLAYCDKLSGEWDKMSAHRMKCQLEGVLKE